MVSSGIGQTLDGFKQKKKTLFMTIAVEVKTMAIRLNTIQ